jgi:hypothetical protein
MLVFKLLHLQHTGHHLSLDGAEHHVLDVDSVNSSSDYFSCLYVKPRFVRKECQPLIGLTYSDRQL